MNSRNTLCTILLMLLFAAQGRSQSRILETEVTFSEQTAAIRDFLNAVGNAAGFTFSYGPEVPVDRTMTISGGKRTVGELLDEMFQNDSLAYVERGNKVLIIPASKLKPKHSPNQTVRGRIIDQDSKIPLMGVNVLLRSSDKGKGTITDKQGHFRFEKVSTGRHELQCSHVGYKPRLVAEFMVGSGKETVIRVEMEETPIEISEVKITSLNDRSKPINSLAVVSGRGFSAYEVENYPGSISDISRAAVSFPGVVSPNDGQNHIIIRGNSPKGLQWRMEGVEIPNLNHFSDIGASGGGVNVVSNNMLAGSDFITGAFPAEYGNALSGVFDLRMRAGNNEKHEQTIQLGLIGTEIMAEGPISKSTNTTYIAQYRYSTLKIMQKLGVELESVPDFQDLSFKLYHPTEKAGVFSLFGIGGLSHEIGAGGYDMHSDMFTSGISHGYTLDQKTFLKSILVVSARKFTWYEKINIGSLEDPIDRVWDTQVLDYTAKGSFIVNRKLNSRHRLKAGLMYETVWDRSFMGWHSDTLMNRYANPGHTYVDSSAHAGTLQVFGNWNYRIGRNLVLNTGMHFIQFYLNNNYSLEPRIGLRWRPSPRHTVSAGFGIHSRKESMTLYLGERTLADGTQAMLNTNLELSKAQHYVLGYEISLSRLLHLRAEVYYQKLYDIPAYPFPPYFTTMNFDFGFEGNVLTNYGTGYNTGLEFTLERYLANGFQILWNATVFDSQYRNKLGTWLPSKYNGRYATNGLVIKEFPVGRGRQNTLSFSSRYILSGGMRYLPIDQEASAASGTTIRNWDNGFQGQFPDYFRIDLLLKFRRNKPGYTAEWSLDFLNLLNRENVRNNYWDNIHREIRYTYQNPLIFVLTYRIQF